MEDYINEFGKFIYGKLQEKLKSHEEYQRLHKIYDEVNEKKQKICYNEYVWTDDFGEDFYSSLPIDFTRMRRTVENYEEDRAKIQQKLEKSIFRKGKYRSELEDLDSTYEYCTEKLAEYDELTKHIESVGYDRLKFEKKFEDIKKDLIKEIIYENSEELIVSMALSQAILKEGHVYLSPQYSSLTQTAMEIICSEVKSMLAEEKQCSAVTDLKSHFEEIVSQKAEDEIEAE